MECGAKNSAMTIFLLGPPGSGKSTQAMCLAERFGIPRIAAGDLLRVEIATGSPLGQKVKSFVEAGMLVPDDLVTAVVLQRLKQSDCTSGVVLDGYPRTVPQAEALRQVPFVIDFLVEIDLDEDEIVRRLEGRRIHPASGRTYHVRFHPPKVADRDDLTGEPLVHRQDDREEVIRRRVALFRSETRSVLAYYERGTIRDDGSKPLRIRISGEGLPETICQHIVEEIIGRLSARQRGKEGNG